MMRAFIGRRWLHKGFAGDWSGFPTDHGLRDKWRIWYCKFVRFTVELSHMIAQ